jgi:hypothetical protein
LIKSYTLRKLQKAFGDIQCWELSVSIEVQEHFKEKMIGTEVLETICSKPGDAK